MENRIKKVAYKTPPQENWNEFRDAEQKNPNFITEEQYKMLLDAGFTHGLGLLEHGSEIAKRALITAEKVGLKYYVRDAVNWANILHPDYYYYNAENYKEYQKYSSFAGVYIFDEPNVAKFGDLGKMVQGYYDFFKGVGEPIVNLLPTYANHIEQLGASSYEEYIEKYCQAVPTDYILFDHYPFRVKDRTCEYLRDDYLYNCKVVADACKRHGREYRAFIQSSVMDRGKTDFLPKMLDFQIHTHLAHGAKTIIYYYYWGDETGGNINGLIDWDGNPTSLYYGAQKIHAEISAYEQKLCQCKWQNSVCVKGGKGSENAEEFSRLNNSFVGITAEYDALVGLFDDGGKKAYYVVNYTYPRKDLENTVEIDLDCDCIAFVGGKKTSLKKGKAKLTLPSAGGAFICPEN